VAFCVSCGFEVDSAWNVCPKCGTAVVGEVPVIPHPTGLQSQLTITHTNERATVGLILGIFSLSISILSPLSGFLCFFVSFPLAILGYDLSSKGFNRSKEIGIGNVQSVVGMILNGMVMLAGVFLLLLFSD